MPPASQPQRANPNLDGHGNFNLLIGHIKQHTMPDWGYAELL
jgi:hypothetical protein